MIKTLVFNIETIADMQKILRIQIGVVPHEAVKKEDSPPTPLERKRSLVDDITKKYSNIKLRKISPEKQVVRLSEPVTPKQQQTSTRPSSVVTKPASTLPKLQIKVAVEESPRKPAQESPIKIENIQRSFMCISCSEKFQKMTQLKLHLKSCRASATQQFKCFCGKVLATKKDLSTHVAIQHKDNKQQHICTGCKKSFTSLGALQSHMLLHKSSIATPKSVYLCHVCNAKYPDLQRLKDHRVSCKTNSSESWSRS